MASCLHVFASTCLRVFMSSCPRRHEAKYVRFEEVFKTLEMSLILQHVDPTGMQVHFESRCTRNFDESMFIDLRVAF